MNSHELKPDMNVETVLTTWSETIPVFVRYQTACVGCSMTPFCSLQDVATLYELDLDQFLADLNAAVHAHESPT